MLLGICVRVCVSLFMFVERVSVRIRINIREYLWRFVCTSYVSVCLSLGILTVSLCACICMNT